MMFFMSIPCADRGDSEMVSGKRLPGQSPLGDPRAHPGLGQVLSAG